MKNDTVLQKFIADSGLCSRRKAEEFIRSGKVKVNGERAELGMKVGENDSVTVCGEKIGLPEKKIYIKLNKPIGYVCTNAVFREEKSVFDLLDDFKGKKLFAVGRLDKNSRGLVLLTNDGEWANRLIHPRYGHEKKYLAVVNNKQLPVVRVKEIIASFKKGVDIGEGDGTVKVKNIQYSGNGEFEIILTEGKKRQIRRMFRASGLEVVDLVRTKIGDIVLGDLPEGEWGHVKSKS